MRPLAPAVKTVWLIKQILLWGILSLGALAWEVVNFFDERTLPFGVLSGVVILVGILFSVFLPRLRYRFWRFDLRQEELYVERGIINRIRTIVPLRRIQHLDVSQDILEREFELGNLIVHTAGTRASTVVVPGLQFEEAEHLRDTVKHYILEDAV